jgi:uncharacterized RDD family membrane protein YckC
VIVDGVVALVIGIPLSVYTGLYDGIVNGEAVPENAELDNILVGWVWFFVVNSYWLIKRGQTVGTRLLGIRISDFRTDAVPSVWRLLVRIAVAAVADLLGPMGNLFALVDILFIFGKNRRCIHDLIAGTRMVDTWS